jgi:hypothetical protein
MFFHKLGNIVITQNSIKMIQEKSFQTIGSTHIKMVDAFNSRENTTIDNISESIIIYGLYLSSDCSLLAHKITGNKGRTQGAKIVSAQAKKDTISKFIHSY